ncbi:carbohydrate-binding domain-containing protein [Leucobacter chromiireducens]|uniref:carbohydrate-binding domain-containing protein n=1 Tax=Leucobacter chromiireducens TaxID=283877 RepID=UPI000F6313C8|nr:carbohydrate-binding domain-containing protein [Leucobacter chromiireducens]
MTTPHISPRTLRAGAPRQRALARRALAGCALVSSLALLAGCTTATQDPGASAQAEASAQTEATAHDDAAATSATGLTPAAVLADNAEVTEFGADEWDVADAIAVDLGSPSGTGIESSAGTVTVTAAGVYRFSGALTGQLVVAAPDDARVVLILDGVTITNSAGSAIHVQQADDVAIHLADGSTNRVSDAETYAADADANAAIFSTADLTISGSGSLTVTGNGNDGITSKDDLVILDGTLAVTARADALRGKDALVIEGGELSLTAETGDGMYSKGDADEAEIDWSRGVVSIAGGTIDITAGDDGIQAFTDAVIGGGTVTVMAADDGVKGEAIVAIGELPERAAPTVTVVSATEGIEAASIGISGGTTSVTASDDGVNASGNTELQALIAGTAAADTGATGGPQSEFQDTGETLAISGGELTVDAEGDGLDSNGILTVTGGTVVVYGPTRGGNGSLDTNGELTVTGGTITAFGPGDMEQTPTTDGQGWVIVSAAIAAGQTGTIVADDGTEIGSFDARKQAASILVSAAEVTAGASYSVVVDGETVGTAIAGEGGAAGPGGGAGGGQPAQGGPAAPGEMS